jgi:hypothetical protein
MISRSRLLALLAWVLWATLAHADDAKPNKATVKIDLDPKVKKVFVEFERPDLGTVLSRIAKLDDDVVGKILRKAPDDLRARLIKELGKSVRFSVIEHLYEDEKGELRFDPKAEPTLVVSGRTSGILSDKQLGIGADCFYEIRVKPLITTLEKEGDSRTFLWDYELELKSRELHKYKLLGLGEVSLTLAWHLADEITLEDVKRALRKSNKTPR